MDCILAQMKIRYNVECCVMFKDDRMLWYNNKISHGVGMLQHHAIDVLDPLSIMWSSYISVVLNANVWLFFMIHVVL